MKIYSTNIISEIEALRIKDSEKDFYDEFKEVFKGIGITKITPIQGLNIDLMYIEDNNVVFLKFMDTTNEIYSILEEDLLEVMKEDFDNLKEYIDDLGLNIKYNLIYCMPYVDIDDDFGFTDFVRENVVDKCKYKKLKENPQLLKNHFKGRNDDVFLNLFRFYVAPEYHVLRKEENYRVNKNFKKITFSKDNNTYCSLFLRAEQIKHINSINYGDEIFLGASGTSKTTIMISRAIKLSKIYPKEKFLIITFNKQTRNEIRSYLNILCPDIKNIHVHNLHGFIFKVAKKYNLVIDYESLKKDFYKTFNNLMLQVKNLFKDKRIYKGIFIDEIENFRYEEILIFKNINYDKNGFFNLFINKARDIHLNIKDFEDFWKRMGIENETLLKFNYRSNKDICDFVNNFTLGCENKILSMEKEFPKNYYWSSIAVKESDNKVEIINAQDIDEKIETILWEIENLVKEKGYNYNDIAVIYPFNKRKLKNKNTIYFQYILKEALKQKDIPYMVCSDEITNLQDKYGVTLSNVYSISNLEFKVVIVCELEMLYNQIINQKSDVNKILKDMNIIYTCITRATDKLIVVSTLKDTDLIKMLLNENKKEG